MSLCNVMMCVEMHIILYLKSTRLLSYYMVLTVAMPCHALHYDHRYSQAAMAATYGHHVTGRDCVRANHLFWR